MAVQAFGSADALTVKLWAQGLNAEVLKKTHFGQYSGKSSNSLCQVLDRTSKGPGDQVTFGIRMQLSGEGKAGNAGLEGNEESWTDYTEAVVINQLRHAVRFYAGIDQQRVPFTLREEGRLALSDWWAGRLDEVFFNHLCGYDLATANTRDGFNTIVNPQDASDTDHIVYAGAGISDQDLDSTETFDVDLIDKAVEKAKTISPAVRPFVVNGNEYYVAFLHPYQVTSLRASDSTWFANMQAALQGGFASSNPIFTGALGVHNGVILRESTRVTQGIDDAGTGAQTDVRRAVLCGAQACVAAYGREGGRPERYRWVEEVFDYKNEVGVAASLIFGLTAVRFNSKDYGKIVMSSYAVAS